MVPVNQNKSETLNEEDRGDNNDKDRDDDNDESSISEEYDDDSDDDIEDQEQAAKLATSSAKIPLTSISKLLETSDNDTFEGNFSLCCMFIVVYSSLFINLFSHFLFL